MIRYLSLYPIFFFSIIGVWAQNDTIKHHLQKHKILLSPTSVFEDIYLVVYGTNSIWLNIGYEYQINNKSIGIKTGHIIFNGNIDGKMENLNKGFFIHIFSKYYITPQFFVGLTAGYQYNYIYQKEKNDYFPLIIHENMNRILSNIRVGFETIKSFYIDIGLGTGFSYYFYNMKEKKGYNFKKTNDSYWLIYPRIEANIGYKF
ncbi:MAG: hypothetical protein OHK0036_10050 [Bacteroidia bacterium]